MTIVEIIRQTILNNPLRKDVWWETVRSVAIIDKDIFSTEYSLDLDPSNTDTDLLTIMTYLYQSETLNLRVIDFDKAKDFITIYGSRYPGDTKHFIFVQAWKTGGKLSVQILSDVESYIFLGKDKISK